ncbi:MAG: MFS transporter, partial [Bdellovibrionaceae bacterium]|nr:MFS transporter [Bdellovibrio sp.]
KKLESNVFKLSFFSFFQCFLVIIPVIVPYWQGLGLTLKEIFMLQGIFGVSLIIFDAPAGYLADIFGRKRSLVIGTIVSAVGWQVLWLGNTFSHFVIYEIILGLGLSLQSGCDIAMLYDTLDKLEMKGRKAGYLGRRLTFATVGEGVASLLGGALAAINIALPAYVNAINALIPVAVAFTIYEPQGDKLDRGSHIENFRAIGKALFGHSHLLTLAIFNFIFYGFATYCAVWSLQPYWKDRGVMIAMFGYLWAANNFAVAIVSRYAHWIEEKFGSTNVVIAISILPIIGYLGMGYIGGLWGLLFTLAFPIVRGLNQVIFQDAINSRVPADIRATTNSIGSLGIRALFVIFGPLIGHVLDVQGSSEMMKVLGYVYLVGFFVIALPLLSQRRAFRLG